MRHVLLPCLMLGLSALLTLPLLAADDDDTKQKKGKKQRGNATARAFELPDDLKLDDEQQKKLAELKEKYTAKIGELRQQVTGILTDEQRRARAAAAKAAREAGKQGKELREAADAAIELTEEQAKKTEEARAALREALATAKQEVLGLLSKEQRKQIRQQRKEKD